MQEIAVLERAMIRASNARLRYRSPRLCPGIFSCAEARKNAEVGMTISSVAYEAILFSAAWVARNVEVS